MEVAVGEVPAGVAVTKWTVAFRGFELFEFKSSFSSTPLVPPPPSLFSASSTHSPAPSVAQVLCHEWWWPWKVASTPALKKSGSSCSRRSRLTATSEAFRGVSAAFKPAATLPLGAALPLKLLSM